jgi:prolyl-tRNA editing enzyme YbaK/EbsC (Cys-tRNA(Pro) deacylase)
MATLSPRAQQVQDRLAALDLDGEVIELAATVRTPADVAAAVGCALREVATAHLFRALESGRAVLVIASAASAVDPAEIGELVGEPVDLGHPEWVLATTGYPVGGVPPLPLAHDEHAAIFIDEDLMELEALWGAAGTPTAAFRLTPGQLRHATRGRVVSIA